MRVRIGVWLKEGVGQHFGKAFCPTNKDPTHNSDSKYHSCFFLYLVSTVKRSRQKPSVVALAEPVVSSHRHSQSQYRHSFHQPPSTAKSPFSAPYNSALSFIVQAGRSLPCTTVMRHMLGRSKIHASGLLTTCHLTFRSREI